LQFGRLEHGHFRIFADGGFGSEAAIDNCTWRTSASHLKGALHQARFSALPMAAIGQDVQITGSDHIIVECMCLLGFFVH
jgi:hypothetical protein